MGLWHRASHAARVKQGAIIENQGVAPATVAGLTTSAGTTPRRSQSHAPGVIQEVLVSLLYKICKWKTILIILDLAILLGGVTLHWCFQRRLGRLSQIP